MTSPRRMILSAVASSTLPPGTTKNDRPVGDLLSCIDISLAPGRARAFNAAFIVRLCFIGGNEIRMPAPLLGMREKALKVADHIAEPQVLTDDAAKKAAHGRGPARRRPGRCETSGRSCLPIRRPPVEAERGRLRIRETRGPSLLLAFRAHLESPRLSAYGVLGNRIGLLAICRHRRIDIRLRRLFRQKNGIHPMRDHQSFYRQW